jgi:arylsulfatase A-like enzyme
MTGWYPHTRGHRSMEHLLHADEPCLLHHLKNAGWHVWWAGKNDLTLDVAGACHERYLPVAKHPNLHADQSWRGGPHDYSFYAGRLESSEGESVYLDSDWMEVLEAARVIKNHPPGQPLCLYLCLEYPHPPYGVESPYYESIDRSALPSRIAPESLAPGKPALQAAIRTRQDLDGHDEAWWTELRATYYGMCARVDAQVGVIVEALRQAGLYDETALFFWSDHGDYTGDYGVIEKAQNLFEDCLVHVPLVIKPPGPGGCRPGVRKALVELLDLPATVYELAGISPAYSHFGRSLVPLFKNDTGHREAVLCEGGRLPAESHCTESKANVPGNLYWPRISAQNEMLAAHGKAIMCRTARTKYVYRREETDEFYDLETDPGERINRIHDPSLAKEIQAARKRVMDFLVETADVVPWQADPRDVPFPTL